MSLFRRTQHVLSFGTVVARLLRKETPLSFAREASFQQTMTQDLTFRLAQSSDIDKILKLSEGLYNGGDYLPARFHTWMKMENLYVMLAFSGDKLVSLVVSSIVDGGMTVVDRASRTLPEVRGRGIVAQLAQAMHAFVRKKHPSVHRRRFVRDKDRDPSAKWKTVVRREKLCCYVEKAILRSVRSQPNAIINSVEVESCPKDYLCDVVFSPPVRQKLFPDNVIFVDSGFPIEPLRSNVDYLMQEIGDSVYFAVDKSPDDALPRSVSFGVLSRRVKFMCWATSIYSSDPVLYQAHLVHQFKCACEVIKGDFMFQSYHDLGFTNCGKIAMEELLKAKLEEEITRNFEYLFEEKLPARHSCL